MIIAHSEHLISHRPNWVWNVHQRSVTACAIFWGGAMSRAGLESENWSNPELVLFDSANHGTAPDPEAFNASTLDPSHIIHLIRQLLPIPADGLRAELPPDESGVFLSPKIVYDVSSDKKPSLEGGPARQNGSLCAVQVAARPPTKERNATISTSTGHARESFSADLSFAGLTDKAPSIEDCNHIQEDGNHTKQNGICKPPDTDQTEQIGSTVQSLRDVSDMSGSQGGKVREENEDILEQGGGSWKNLAEHFEPALTSKSLSQPGGEREGTSLDVSEAEETVKQVEKDACQKVCRDDDAREEAGCVLWDLAATESHANFLIAHHILDVLLAVLRGPLSDRTREICLGVFGNLACHPGPVRAMVATEGLVHTVVQQLFGENIPSLTETCRLLSAGLHSEVTVIWVESLKPDHVLERIMWMAGNTLNSQLLEKCTELILVMVDSRRDAALVFLPSLLRLGLPELLANLIDCELTAIADGTSSHGDVVLDIVLQIAEAISISEDSASQLAASGKLFPLSCQVIRLSASDEIGPSGITALVLIANLLTEEAGLIEQVLLDAVVVGRLLALVPCAGDDPGARNALWSVLGRICSWLITSKLENPHYRTSGTIAVLADGCSLLLDDLDIHQQEDIEEDYDRGLVGQDATVNTSRGLQAKLATIGNMMRVMEQWTAKHGDSPAKDLPLFRSVRNAITLLRKHNEYLKD